jgi:hypothetical protein
MGAAKNQEPFAVFSVESNRLFSAQKARKTMTKPSAIVRNLEDSPDWLDQRLVAAYLRTKYWTEAIQLDDRGYCFEVGQPHPTLFDNQLEHHGFEHYAFITAWNPTSRALDQWHNRWRNLNLEFEIQPHCRLLRRGLGVAHEEHSDWPPEESFLALDIPLEKAVELGRLFGQNALVCWQKGGLPELWWL